MGLWWLYYAWIVPLLWNYGGSTKKLLNKDCCLLICSEENPDYLSIRYYEITQAKANMALLIRFSKRIIEQSRKEAIFNGEDCCTPKFVFDPGNRHECWLGCNIISFYWQRITQHVPTYIQTSLQAFILQTNYSIICYVVIIIVCILFVWCTKLMIVKFWTKFLICLLTLFYFEKSWRNRTYNWLS